MIFSSFIHINITLFLTFMKLFNANSISPLERASRGRPENDAESSLIPPSRKSRQIQQLLDPSERNRSTPKYDLPQIKQLINKQKKEYNSITKEINDDNESKKTEIRQQQQQKNLKMIKLMPYVNNDYINNIYKIYAPYIKQQSPIKYNKYSLEKNAKNQSINYLKNLEKYNDYYNIYKPMKAEGNGQRVNMIPNRKLSPIKKGSLNL